MLKKPVGKHEYKQFRRDRYAAFMSMDKDKLEQYCFKYHVPVPDGAHTFWAGIHKARVTIEDMPIGAINESVAWLKDHGEIIPGGIA